jgi:hypothetical protein
VLPDTVAAETCDMLPPVELTVRLEAEIVPRTVALALRILTAVPVAEMLPGPKLLPEFVTSIVLPEAVRLVLPVTVIPPELL